MYNFRASARCARGRAGHAAALARAAYVLTLHAPRFKVRALARAPQCAPPSFRPACAGRTTSGSGGARLRRLFTKQTPSRHFAPPKLRPPHEYS